MLAALPRHGAALVGLLVLGACAGRSERTGSEHSVGGAGGSGGTSGGSGGTSATGGASAAGGASATGGGISVSGGASGTGGTGGTIDIGAAGQLAAADTPRCLQPLDPGPCRGAVDAWAFNPRTLQCEPFVYGGCEGNDNRFDGETACRATCVAGLPSGCGSDVDTRRPAGCPCVEDSQCGSFCASPSVETTGQCQPAPAGYCGESCCSEGECLCRVTGEHLCGV